MSLGRFKFTKACASAVQSTIRCFSSLIPFIGASSFFASRSRQNGNADFRYNAAKVSINPFRPNNITSELPSIFRIRDSIIPGYKPGMSTGRISVHSVGESSRAATIPPKGPFP